MNYWLIKSEGECYSIDDLKKDTEGGKKAAKAGSVSNAGVPWEGIRNFQARNFMRDGMKVGDLALFYHSMGNPSGVYGVAEISGAAHIDESALNPKDEHFDPRAKKYAEEGKEPLWVCPDVRFVSKLSQPISLEEIKEDSELRSMLVAKPGQRLSVMPVLEKHFKKIVALGK